MPRALRWSALGALPLLAAGPALEGPEPGAKTILSKDVEAHVSVLAAPALMGRDSPSLGLERAARYIAARFEEAGLEPLEDDDFFSPYDLDLAAPDPADCQLDLMLDGGEPLALEYGRDFVPVAGCTGAARG